MPEIFPHGDDAASFPALEDVLSDERKQVGLSTDLKKNDADPHGDGDQSPIRRVLPGTPAQALIDVWCAGTPLGLALDTSAPSFVCDLICTPFARHCATGNAEAIAAALAATPAAALPALLTLRHSNIRMAALHWCVAGSRCLYALQPADAGRANHLAVARLLVEAGAPLEAKDVLGMTALHHATTGVFSRQSLAIAAYLVERGANVNPRNRAGRTPLVELTMASFGNKALLPAVVFMLEVGCDPALADTDGISPISLASAAGVLDRS